MTSVTSRPLNLNDWPKSPCAVASRYATNWSGKSGLSRPQRARRAARASFDAFGLRESRSGDPGIIRNSTKLSRTIAAIVRIACRIRRRR